MLSPLLADDRPTVPCCGVHRNTYFPVARAAAADQPQVLAIRRQANAAGCMGGSRRLDRRDCRKPEGRTCAKPKQDLASGWVHTTRGLRWLVEQPGPVELGHREPDRFGVDRHLKRSAKRID